MLDISVLIVSSAASTMSATVARNEAIVGFVQRGRYYPPGRPLMGDPVVR
jgi:hypothetical protein